MDGPLKRWPDVATWIIKYPEAATAAWWQLKTANQQLLKSKTFEFTQEGWNIKGPLQNEAKRGHAKSANIIISLEPNQQTELPFNLESAKLWFS